MDSEWRPEILVLFGAPTTGKDTITAALAERSSRFAHFKKFKVGQGSKHGYTSVTEAQLAQLRQEGGLVSEVERYGSTYAVGRHELQAMLELGVVPVIHTAELSEAQCLRSAGAAIVALECTRGSAALRLAERDPHSVEERLVVFDHVVDQLRQGTDLIDLRISTDRIPPTCAAAILDGLFSSGPN